MPRAAWSWRAQNSVQLPLVSRNVLAVIAPEGCSSKPTPTSPAALMSLSSCGLR